MTRTGAAARAGTAAALLILAGACGNGPTAPAVYDQPGGPVTVAPGADFVVAVESNASTGYSWRQAAVTDEHVVVLVDHTYDAPSFAPVGAPGREYWRYHAVAPGEATIALEYVRPFETGLPPARTFTLAVRVR